MTAPFDTLKLARRFEAAGIENKQAGDMAEAIAEATTASDVSLATKSDIAALKTNIAALRQETKTDIAEAKADLLKWVVGIVGFQTVAILGGVAALLRLLH